MRLSIVTKFTIIALMNIQHDDYQLPHMFQKFFQFTEKYSS